MTVNASQANPGEITGDVPLTWEQVRDAAEATRTGMDIDNVYFLVNVESLGGAVAQGVQMKIDVTIAP